MKKRILLMCGTFYPNNNPRAVQCTELYKELENRGYEIDLCIPEKKQLFTPDEVNNILLAKEPSKEKNFIKKYTFLKGIISKTACFFIGQKAFYIYYRWIKKAVDLNRYDVLISVSAPFYNIVLGARLLKKCRKHSIVSICDNGDPFYDPKKHSFIVKEIQIHSYKQFDYVCFPVENARPYYSKYVDEKKMKIIPQGRDFSNIRLKKYRKNDTPTFAYAGCFFTDIRNPDSFLNALEEIDRPFLFVLFTETIGEVYEKILLKHKKKLKNRLKICSFLPRVECIYELSGMDFLVNFENISATQTPSKLIDYSLSKRPIMSVNQNRINKKQINDFMNGLYDDRVIIDISQYDIKNVANKYEMLMEKEND